MPLERRRQAVQREKKVAAFVWIFNVALSTLFMLIGGWKVGTTQGLWFGILACFWLLVGAVFFLKSVMNQHEVELLGELASLDAHLTELRQLVEGRAPRTP